jgi:beta-RFAP synthase
MIRVDAPSRLHFGMLSCTSAASWPSLEEGVVLPARQFGGVGLMVERPGVHVRVQPAGDWSAHGPLAERALAIARQFVHTLPPSVVQPHEIHIDSAAPEHAGLGTGTQLGLAVSHALALSLGQELDAPELARRIGRGQRSALGVHGFAQGGFLVEAGKKRGGTISPLVARAELPAAWRVVLIIPAERPGLHGPDENQAIARLMGQNVPLDLTDTLARLVLLGMLPALAEQDLQAFGEALYDFNVLVGEVFSLVQKGRYSSPLAAEIVSFVRQQGVRGAGQSSWGPALFAIAADEDRGQDLARKLRARFHLADNAVMCVPASRHGAHVERPQEAPPPMAEVIAEEPALAAMPSFAGPNLPAANPFAGNSRLRAEEEAESALSESTVATAESVEAMPESALPPWRSQPAGEVEEEVRPRLRPEVAPSRTRRLWLYFWLAVIVVLHVTAFGILFWYLVYGNAAPPEGNRPPEVPRIKR